MTTTIVVCGGLDAAEADAPGGHPCGLCQRLGRLLGSIPRHLPGPLGSRWPSDLPALMSGATGPIVVVDAAYAGHDSPLVDVVALPRPGSAVLVGVEGPAPAVAVEGGEIRADLDATTHAGGAIRIAAQDVPPVAAALRAGATDPAEGPVGAVLRGAIAAGVRLAAVEAAPFVASVETDPARRAQVLAAVTASDEHRIRLRRSAREADGFYSTFVVRRLSTHVTGLLVRTRVTPNQVTLAAFALALAAAAVFAIGGRPAFLAGALLLQASLVVDCVDGELARYTRTHSALGAWLDAGTDRVKEFVVYAALAYAASGSAHSAWLLAAATLGLQVVRHFVDFGFSVRQEAVTGASAGAAGGADAATGPDGRPPAGQAWGTAATALSERTNRTSWLVWAKRVVIMPIGERWLVISVVTPLAGPRAALATLLVLGAVAGAYTTAGRVLRSLARRVGAGARTGLLVAAADPGIARVPVARLSGGWLGWLIPAASRLIEYGTVAVLAFTGALDPAATFCALFVLSVWHYDVWYRIRFIGAGPRQWASLAVLGAPARTVVAVAAALIAGPGAAGAVVVTLAALVLAIGIADGTQAWRRWLSTPSPVPRVPRFTLAVGA